jgi:sialate O-acetylesterase
VLVGEVWFASGQSNMLWALAQSEGGRDEIAAADHPGIRFFMAQLIAAPSPKSDVPGVWQASSPQTAGRFSAVGYHFARKLNQELGVPVGVIQAAWGGKPVATFTSREALASIPETKSQLEDYEKALASYDPEKEKTRHAEAVKAWEKQMDEWRASKPAPNAKPPAKPKPAENPGIVPGKPTTVYNGIIAPFVGYTIRGAIWYQGEADANEMADALNYGKVFPLMIRDWRGRWGDDFRFLWVQLANFKSPVMQPGTNDPWAVVQDQQRRSLSVEKTGMAVINDIGAELNIHPPNKKDVGERLARWTLADDFGKDVVKCGPLYKDSKIDGPRITVTFDHIGKGLKSADGSSLKRFKIQDYDGNWYWAHAKIEGNSVVVSSAEVPRAAAVRYAWVSNPTGANLVNSEDLPASIFTTQITEDPLPEQIDFSDRPEKHSP